MIKAKKSLILTLVAAMMIFAFGATASFANVVKSDGVAVSGDWAADYSYVTVNNTKYDAVRTWDPATGIIKASLDDEDMTPAVRANVPLVADVYFYDFTGAKLAVNGNALVTNYDKATFEGLFVGSDGVVKAGNINTLVLTAPEYVSNYKDLTSTQKTAKPAALNGWTVKAETPADYDADALADQSLTIVGIIESQKADGTATNPYRVDESVISKAVVVKGTTQTAADVKFFKDEVSSVAKDALPVVADTAIEVAFTYDGAAHKVVSNDIAGFPVTWSVLNTKTGKYDTATECPSVTNVGDTAKVKATITWTETKKTSATTTTTETKTLVYPINLKVVANAEKPFFGFVKDGNKGFFKYAVEGTEYDVYSYIEAKAPEKKDPYELEDAVKADQATLIEYFKDFYEVKEEVTKADPNTINLTMKAKTLKDAEVKELEKKYKALMDNYGIKSGEKIAIAKSEDLGSKGTLSLNYDGVLAPEIEFIDSPTFFKAKAKKLKKKAVSFTVTAVSSNNEPVTYKLINAPAKIKIDKTSGTITLAKKLKKGTYKITVKAYIPKAYSGMNGGKFYPSETHAIKIKVKK